jgi:hypothetical protein
VIRKKYRYRQLIFSGKLILPHKRAAQLLGPDCMYQLYALQGAKKAEKTRKSAGKSRTVNRSRS